jgi:hypothetical protein
VGASFASWDKFSVIEDGSAEMKLGYYTGDWWLGVRYGLVDKLELYSTMDGIANTKDHSSNYVIGARYQIIESLGGFVDLALPTVKDSTTSHDFGLRPGVNFSMKFSDKLSLGTVLQAGLTFGEWMPDSSATFVDLGVGVELDYMFSDNIGVWLGIDFTYDDMTNQTVVHRSAADSPDGREFDAVAAISPGLGFFFTKDNLTVGTMIGLDLGHQSIELDDKGKNKSAIGLTGGVEFAVKF